MAICEAPCRATNSRRPCSGSAKRRREGTEVAGRPEVNALVVPYAHDAGRREGGDRCPATVLFTDLRTAYYRAAREVVVGGEMHAGVLRDIARRLGVGPDAMQLLLDAL
eukprot:304463-Lingulodinium_polyedra.AAC.1